MNRFCPNRRTVLSGLLALGAMPAGASTPPFASSRFDVVVRGTGPDVILIHGLNSGRGVWNKLAPQLAGYRAHYIQIAGFAGTAARGNASDPIVSSLASELARYIREARLIRPAIIGHSMGGTLALMLASRWPARVGRLMVVDMYPAPAGLIGGTAAGLGPLAQNLQQLFGATPQGRANFAQVMKILSPPGDNNDPDVTGRALTELAGMDLTTDLARITAPATIVYATPSPGGSITPVSVRQRYADAYRNLKGAKFVPIADSGHMVMLDQPTRFGETVKQFLGSR